MAGQAAAWLARRSLLARTVTIKVRYADFTTVTRSHTATPTRDQPAIIAEGGRIARPDGRAARPVRLLGVSVHNLCAERRLDPGGLATIRKLRSLGTVPEFLSS